MAVSDLPKANALFQEYLGGATVVALGVKYDVSYGSIYKRLRTVPAFQHHCKTRRRKGTELQRRRSAERTRLGTPAQGALGAKAGEDGDGGAGEHGG